MSAPNGHSHENPASISGPPPTALGIATPPQYSADRVQELVAALEVPFDSSQIEWRVTNTTKNQQPARGQVIPYANQRAYTDRLNALLTPAGWTRRYIIHTSANFERSKDQKIVAKVLVTCELTIFGLGSHSATGEEWADDDNVGTSAEAQAFKRACSCFGLGRYFYHFTGTWVDLDERKRPKTVPKLAGWATSEGWRRGLRPVTESGPKGRNGAGAYPGARRVEVQHASLHHGDRCPECQRGKVYPLHDPGLLVRMKGQAPIEATVYALEKLRCNLCGETFTAVAPEGVGEEKYDATTASMIALLRYGSGFPWNRLESLEESLGIPLPAATQCEIVTEAAAAIRPAMAELIRHAAQGEVLHNDDTSMPVLTLRRDCAP